MLSLEVWQMEPEKTVNKKKINLHVNSSTTVKRRSKNFYTVQTRTSWEVSTKLLLWWNEKYPFRNAKLVVKNRTSVYCLLTRTFSLKFLHVLTQTFSIPMQEPSGKSCLAHFPYENWGSPLGCWHKFTAAQYEEYSLVATMRISCQTVSSSYISKICQDVLNLTLMFTENTLKW